MKIQYNKKILAEEDWNSNITRVRLKRWPAPNGYTTDLGNEDGGTEYLLDYNDLLDLEQEPFSIISNNLGRIWVINYYYKLDSFGQYIFHYQSKEDRAIRMLEYITE